MMRGFLFSLLLGIVAGVAGGMMGASIYTKQVFIQQPTFSRISIEPGSSSSLDQKALQEIRMGIVEIYAQKKALSNDPFLSGYRGEELLGYGGILTSDGYILTHSSLFTKGDMGYVAKTAQGNLYTISKPVIDPTTGFTFARLEKKDEDIRGLHPLVLGKKKEQIQKTDVIYTFNAQGDVEIGYIGNPRAFIQKNRSDYLFVSDIFKRGILLSDISPRIPQLLFDEHFSFIGVSSRENALFIPTYTIQHIFDDILKEKELQRIALDLQYIDLSTMTFDTQYPAYGALLYTDPVTGIPGVKWGSPAYIAGLRSGDIVSKVQDIPLHAQQDLTDILLSLSPGMEVTFEILRDGDVQEISIPL